jgi:hypothetical protein
VETPPNLIWFVGGRGVSDDDYASELPKSLNFVTIPILGLPSCQTCSINLSIFVSWVPTFDFELVLQTCHF